MRPQEGLYNTVLLFSINVVFLWNKNTNHTFKFIKIDKIANENAFNIYLITTDVL